jgi:pimeloyl-ACP methyl ester carboxylesterase
MISDKCEEKKVKIENIEIPFWIYGDPANSLVFYLHGFVNAFSENSGDLPIRYLMKHYCIVAFDMPGWGVNKKLTINTGSIINGIAENLNKKDFFIFGTSYGGIVGLLYSRKNGEKVKGLILAGVPQFSSASIIYLLFFLKFFSFRKIHVFSDLLKLFDKSSMNKTPTLLLYSKADKIAPISQGNYYAKIIQKSKLVVVNDRSHGWLLHRIIDNNFGKEINTFLNTYS